MERSSGDGLKLIQMGLSQRQNCRTDDLLGNSLQVEETLRALHMMEARARINELVASSPRHSGGQNAGVRTSPWHTQHHQWTLSLLQSLRASRLESIEPGQCNAHDMSQPTNNSHSSKCHTIVQKPMQACQECPEAQTAVHIGTRGSQTTRSAPSTQKRAAYEEHPRVSDVKGRVT